MSDNSLATEPTKTALENAITWYLTEKMAQTGAPIVTQKFLTWDNQLIYLTRCTVASSAIPIVKVQILKRVAGGVRETGYQLYTDRRLESYENAMIFGTSPSGADLTGQAVTETTAAELLATVSSLQTTARALV
ncbi:hypothetical protein HJC99_00440 [Candidatus Saccharibacteria bacterium]|nr:hypothetical protein [Candidatus Saccharibacteria bacterium]